MQIVPDACFVEAGAGNLGSWWGGVSSLHFLFLGGL